MKKIITVTALVLCMVFAVIGCSAPAAGESPEAGASTEAEASADVYKRQFRHNAFCSMEAPDKKQTGTQGCSACILLRFRP